MRGFHGVGSRFAALAIALTCVASPRCFAAASDAKPQAYSQVASDHVKAALDDLASSGDFDKASATLNKLFDEAVLYTPDDRPDALREVDFARRLVAQLSHVPEDKRVGLLKFLRGNDNLARALVFLVRPNGDAAGTYATLDRLRAQRGEQLDKYANLAAAICVVHHSPKPFARQINENRAESTDAIAIFDYYVRNEGRMLFGVKNVPAELLVYVVDTTASVEDMTWALNKYGGNKEVGKLFFDIKYDYDAFRLGTPKKVTAAGFTLPNILQFGGVCADQAYFACSVGKAIGVPTAYDTGASGEVGHAWVGFLQSDGRNGWWNFDVGRYEAYKGVRGNVMDPQTRQGMPDSYVSLLSELIGTKPENRYNAVALTDAELQLVEWSKASDAAAPTVAAPENVSPASVRAKPRTADTATELAMLELALRQSLGYAPAWFGVRDLATADKLALADKKRWADVLLKLGAKKYPDFTLAILAPMIATIPDPVEQDRLWQTVFKLFQTRFDLAAGIRMAEGTMWEQHGDLDKAGICYTDVVERYANAGPFVIAALQGAEKLLKHSNRDAKVVTLYEQTWAKTKQPKEMAGQFATQSNWYRVGKLYAKKLTEAGDVARAKSVEAQLEQRTGQAAAP